ncbi:MAG TPA: redoxin domain-containing protein [Terriglobia bacterium]|nr:redoxin domain-containing protein [Terriglobia bacterium]
MSVYPSSGPRPPIGRLKLFGLLAAMAIFLAASTRPVMTASQGYGAPKVPDFSIMANDGQTYTPDYLKGNVVLLMFWATWCPYCRKAMPHMNEYANEYANAPFTMLGICGGKDASAWHDYIEQHQLRWPQYLDSNLRMARLFDAHGVPNFFLIDKDGYLVAHWVGWDDSLTNQVEKMIDHALDQPRQQ